MSGWKGERASRSDGRLDAVRSHPATEKIIKSLKKDFSFFNQNFSFLEKPFFGSAIFQRVEISNPFRISLLRMGVENAFRMSWLALNGREPPESGLGPDAFPGGKRKGCGARKTEETRRAWSGEGSGCATDRNKPPEDLASPSANLALSFLGSVGREKEAAAAAVWRRLCKRR